MDSSLLEQFLGPSSTQFQLPPLIEDEDDGDDARPLIEMKLRQIRNSLTGKIPCLNE